MKCAIVIVDTGPLKTLAYCDSLDLLIEPGIPIYISDMVIDELKNGTQFDGNVLAMDFIEKHMGDEIQEEKTGVPAIFDQLKALGEDPGDVSIRRVIEKYEEETDGVEYALLVSEDDKLMRTADPTGHTYMLTTRPFLLSLEKKGVIDDAEGLMIKAEKTAIACGDLPGRGQLTRRKEWDVPPGANRLIKPF